MSKLNWTKQLTRENTLLDRSLRAIAYRDAIFEIGQATISNCLLTGKGKVTSLYYWPEDYKKQQLIITKEFKGKNINKMSEQIVEFLENGYVWALGLNKQKLSKKEFTGYYKNFLKHHAHARGAVMYGYWGEPLITDKLNKSLGKKVNKSKLDNTISIFSSPKVISGNLSKLYHPSAQVIRQKEQSLKILQLNRQEQELIEILSWFTLFYEVGERVASYLYDELLHHLKNVVASQIILEELNWYDPLSFEKFLQGKKLSKKELEQRQQFWILKMINGSWDLLIGEKAESYYEKYLNEEIKSDIQIIKGTTACLGKAKGKVKIIITQEDQKKMNKGDILVSPMTTPRLLTAIKKAAAIITDEGGMTAHAAIVSREFNIPCIVGTKVASKILKDNDLIEVDANKGTVKIIAK